MNVSGIELYQILKGKLGEEQAKMLVTYVDQKVNESFEPKIETLATKKDIYDFSDATKKAIHDLSETTKKDIYNLSETTKKAIYELSEATNKAIYELSEKMNSHLKWLIGLFLGQMAFVFGIVYFILNFSK